MDLEVDEVIDEDTLRDLADFLIKHLGFQRGRKSVLYIRKEKKEKNFKCFTGRKNESLVGLIIWKPCKRETQLNLHRLFISKNVKNAEIRRHLIIKSLEKARKELFDGKEIKVTYVVSKIHKEDLELYNDIFTPYEWREIDYGKKIRFYATVE